MFPDSRPIDGLNDLADLGTDGSAFALIYRPGSLQDTPVELLVGDVHAVDSLSDLPLPTPPETSAHHAAGRHDLLVAIPYRQITERGFACHDDRAPVLTMRVREQIEMSRGQALECLPEEDIRVSDAGFDIDDPDYAEIVRRVLEDEIHQGSGSNFVIRRSFVARIRDYSVRTELSIFRRLLTGELGSHWTFLFHTGDAAFIGASPERHVGMADGTVTMNPISGTYRHPSTGPEVAGLLDFLDNQKEANELYMVVDEELKMMASICHSGGGRVHGPFLKEMARLTHSEYILTGRSDLDVRDVLRETLLAPTVTGSPLENAFRVIARHEPTGRGYYAGVLALIGRDSVGSRTLDSAIMIRTGEFDADGRLRLGVGATLVRDSDPASEVAETHAKAAGMLRAIGLAPAGDGVTDGPTVRETRPSPTADPRVRRALRDRNAALARFWLDEAPPGSVRALRGRLVLVIDGEDTFTAMLRHQLRALGLDTTIARFDDPLRPEAFDFVVVGPGPGDPRDATDPRIATLHGVTRRLLAGTVPFLAICLGHQVLAHELGFTIARRAIPNQGVQRSIDLFGRPERVGFYNTYSAVSDQDLAFLAGLPEPVHASRDSRSGEVHALRGPGFRSVQFHPESVLTQHGPRILAESLTSLIPAPVTG